MSNRVKLISRTKYSVKGMKIIADIFCWGLMLLLRGDLLHIISLEIAMKMSTMEAQFNSSLEPLHKTVKIGHF